MIGRGLEVAASCAMPLAVKAVLAALAVSSSWPACTDALTALVASASIFASSAPRIASSDWPAAEVTL